MVFAPFAAGFGKPASVLPPPVLDGSVSNTPGESRSEMKTSPRRSCGGRLLQKAACAVASYRASVPI
jgi:hypothetical protein